MNKIVFIAPSIKTGGGNRVFIELANILCEEYDISVLFPNNSEEYHTFQKSSNLQYTAIGKKALSKMAKCIIRKSKFPQNPKRSVRFSGKRTKRSVQKRKARNTQKAETKVL